ncbi:hypothetical protein M758_11G112800 [Ceratodon purpureus]|nr:hypothetical protein M758_11G112800 [Ceratodon purpureus]
MMVLHMMPPVLLSYRGLESVVQMEGLSDGLALMPGTPSCCTAFNCLPSFLGGILVLALVEIVCVLYFIIRVLAKKPPGLGLPNGASSSLEYTSSEGSSVSFSLQGNLWVAPLPEGDWSKAVLHRSGKDKKEKDAEKDGTKEGSKRGNDALEIAPVWRHVVLKEGILHLKAADGIDEHISLEGCEVLTVSAGSGPSGKWSKRFPIKLHHPTRILYRECKDCLFYTESGYEKEAWCEVLRATARANTPANAWFLRLKKEFWQYADGAERHVPYLIRFRSGSNHLALTRTEENDVKSPEEPFSKRRFIWKKLLRRGSKGKQPKDTTRSPNAKEELGKSSQRINPPAQGQDEGSSKKGKEITISDDLENSKSASRASQVSDEIITQNESTSSDSDVEKAAYVTPQKENKESNEVLAAALMQGHENERVQKEIDPGLLCLNMIVGRLFFDVYHSESRVVWLRDNIQRLISRIKTPSYIKSITIKELDLGIEPPFATAIRMLPADAGGALALEVDLEWHAGGFITMETRVDIRDQRAQEKVASHMAEPGSAGAAAAAIVSGIEEDLETGGSPDASSTLVEARQVARKKPGPGEDSSRRAGWMNSMKTMMSRVADQVSQVPLLLKIRLVSVKGTCIVSLRAPPTDRIWFSFKEMPNIDLVPEPCIGDHRISSGPLGSFIANQIKVQIRESIVMPYCQDIFLHWMMAEQDDWLPESAFPVAFSADPSENQSSKHILDVQSKFAEENDKNGQPLLPSTNSNGHNESQASPVSEASTHSSNLGSADSGLPHPGPPYGLPIMLMNPPTHPSSQGNLQSSTSSRNQSQKPAISEQPSSQPSIPSRPPGAIVPSSAPSSIRGDKESDLTKPLLDNNDFSKLLGSSSEFDAGLPDKVIDAVYNDLLLQSEGSASENESHHASHQISNQEHSQADLSPGLDSRVSRRTKMFSLGKKMGTKLDERRRIVLEKLREKRTEGSEGGSSRHQGSGSIHM